ncbi:Hypothetical predicted protein [Octopus vulgaris]|uniref:Uncharacterized protein n=1 Tax=Octopus vulgaris TaxID=6645 RepID=A0AA36BDU7_OCTVU|nr:Hypothetical predicted protein [Octopus vulgaris]
MTGCEMEDYTVTSNLSIVRIYINYNDSCGEVGAGTGVGDRAGGCAVVHNKITVSHIPSILTSATMVKH